MDRRSFVKAGSLAYAGTVMLPHSLRPLSTQKGTIKKAVKFGMIDEPLSVLEKFKLLKELGFDGVEPSSPSDLDEKEVVEAIKETGLPVHGLVNSVHWEKPLSDPDPAVREESRAGMEHALKQAKAFGATSVLLVPAVVNKSVSYADAYARSQAEIRKFLPLAEELEIQIALENVWNNFLLSPLEFAQYIDAFDSPWIGAYFDVGNIVNYGWPEHWIQTLGHRIMKLDIKEYSRTKRNDEGLWKGFQVELGEGDCDWAAVGQALKAIGYAGWATAEIPGGNTARLKDIAMRMDRLLDT